MKASTLIFIFEFFGTTLLTIFYKLFLYFELRVNGVTIPITNEFMLVAFLFSYWVISFFSYTVSGAHYNPAVSFAFLFKPEAPFNKILFAFYVIS